MWLVQLPQVEEQIRIFPYLPYADRGLHKDVWNKLSELQKYKGTIQR